MAKKVFVADDSVTIRKAFDLTFSGDSGVEILGAADISSALASVKENACDLIIADASLGSSSGYDLCKQIKSDPLTSTIPVWIMTGPAERLDEDMYEACGACGHVRKPFDTQRMIDKIAVMQSPPEEERSRPSYPPAPAGAPAVARPAAPAAPAAPASSMGRREGKATLMGGPVPPIKHPVAQPQPQRPVVPQPPAPKQEPAPKPASPLPRPVITAPKPTAPASSPAASAPVAPLDAGITSTPAAARALDGLSDGQREAVMALIREVVEKTVWEVVPDMAEAVIREELSRLLKD